jgi:hypothetical protein
MPLQNAQNDWSGQDTGGEVSPVGNVETMPASCRSISPLLLERAGVA